MNIIYPPLVEESYKFILEQGIDVPKAEVYKMLVKKGVITQTGEPTKEAIKQGIVAEFNRGHRTLKEFKREYPIFKHYPSKEFTQQEGIWYVSQKIIADIEQMLKKNNCDRDTFTQVKTYFYFRNYDNPHASIAETKGVFHPLFTQYPDEAFRIVDGLVAVPQSIVEDIARRAKTGEIKANVHKLNELIEIMKEDRQ